MTLKFLKWAIIVAVAVASINNVRCYSSKYLSLIGYKGWIKEMGMPFSSLDCWFVQNVHNVHLFVFEILTHNFYNFLHSKDYMANWLRSFLRMLFEVLFMVSMRCGKRWRLFSSNPRNFCRENILVLWIFSFAHLGDGKTLGLLANVRDHYHYHYPL